MMEAPNGLSNASSDALTIPIRAWSECRLPSLHQNGLNLSKALGLQSMDGCLGGRLIA